MMAEQAMHGERQGHVNNPPVRADVGALAQRGLSRSDPLDRYRLPLVPRAQR
jgi:hypothetical protein